MTRPITHLFFDLGNVLVGLRSGEKLKSLARRKGESVKTFCEKIWSHERAHDYERGQHTCDEYFALLAEDLDLTHTRQELQEAFCDIFFPSTRTGGRGSSTRPTLPTFTDLKYLCFSYPASRSHLRLFSAFSASDLLPRGWMSETTSRHLSKSFAGSRSNPGNVSLYR